MVPLDHIIIIDIMMCSFIPIFHLVRVSEDGDKLAISKGFKN
jgi:hypothetical protein